jgi:glycosyltransferase involved in cell wall biosynthesis
MVLFVGRMDERYKGQLDLIDALDILRFRHPKLRLVFVGGGAALSDWREEARRRGVHERVTFTGRISDRELAEYYSTATLFAMPSENEGFGLVYAEAMAYSLPCVGSDWDAATEVISHGETGLCVPAHNSTALAGALSELLEDRGLRESMGRSGRLRFEKNFTAGVYREKLLVALREWGGFI